MRTSCSRISVKSASYAIGFGLSRIVSVRQSVPENVEFRVIMRNMSDGPWEQIFCLDLATPRRGKLANCLSPDPSPDAASGQSPSA